MKTFFSSKLFTLVLFVAIPVSVYFINVEVQSYLGRRALSGTNLVSRTLSSALGKAKSENKLVLVDVSAIWCSSCRKLDQTVFSDDAVRQTISEDFVFTRLEYESDEGQAFLDEHNARGFPNLWLLDGDGNTVRRLQVTFNPSEFLQQLEMSSF